MASDMEERSAVELGELLRNYSAEVTCGDRKSIDAAIRMLPPGSEVFIASLAGTVRFVEEHTRIEACA